MYQTIIIFQKKSAEAATRGALKEKVLIENSQNSQEKTCVRVLLIKLLASGLQIN